jgi:uncharacterized protein
MARLTRCILALLFACTSITAWGSDLVDGFDAYRRGDYRTALAKFRSAEASGTSLAQSFLGDIYYHGRGVTQDYKEAVRWWRLAAEQGFSAAQSKLGLSYDRGQGVAQDNIRAHMWFNIAASGGDEDSVKGREIAASKMTPPQIEQAQHMARECVNSNYKRCD